MSEKRRDHKKRILRIGESQRKDLTYMYRYQDASKKRRCVYANTLEALREKEEVIQQDLKNQIIFDGRRISVGEMCDRYIAQRPHVSTYYKNNMRSFTKRIKKSHIATMPVMSIKVSIAKQYMIDLRAEGLSYNTARSIHGFLRSVFKSAMEDELIHRNPFDFHLSQVIGKKDKPVSGLTPEAQTELLKYISGDKCFSKRYADLIVLLHTGLRVGELCAITKQDIDFEHRTLRVSKQLQRYTDGVVKITQPKTDAGDRFIPLDRAAQEAILSILSNRKPYKVEPMINGYAGFVFMTKQGNVAKPQMYEALCRRIERGFNNTHTMQIRLTPHVFRHTFCTNLVRGGIDPASLQYLMGHSKAQISLDVYTDKTFKAAETAYFQAIGE